MLYYHLVARIRGVGTGGARGAGAKICASICDLQAQGNARNCFALFVCLTLLASFFLPSHLSLKICIYSVWCLVSLVVSLPRPSPLY